MATITSFTATPTSVASGQSTVLAWTGTATSYSIDQGVGTVTGTNVTVFPTATTAYTLTATDTGGSVTSSVTVTVTGGGTTWGSPTWGDVTWDDPAPAPNPGSAGSSSGAPTVNTFTPGSTSASPGGAVTVNVDVGGATSISVDNGVGTVTNGTFTVFPTTTTTFTLTATNSSGTTTASFTITVTAAGENIRYHQIRRGDRHGGGTQIQMSDGTGRLGDVAGFLEDGTLTKFTGTTGTGLGGGGATTVYGQVPRGSVDGSNRFFRLDFEPVSPYMWLMVNGIEQKPPIDGTAPNPDPDYAINGPEIVYNSPPGPADWHYVKYYAGPIPTPPPPVPVNGTAYLISAHYPDPNSDQWGGGVGFNDTISLFSSPSWFRDATRWDVRTDTLGLVDDNFVTMMSRLNDGSLYLLIAQYHLGNNGGGPPPYDDEFWIYDAWVTINMSDGTSQTWRPTEYEATSGAITNPANAIDGDQSTFAVLLATNYFAGGFSGVALNLKTWIRKA